MGCGGLVLLLLVTLPIFLALVFSRVVAISFDKLGILPEVAFALLLATLIGSMINIPVSRRRIIYEQPQTFFSRFFFYAPPRVAEQIVTVNVGGALIPTGFALYLLSRAPLVPTLIATAAVTLVSRLLSRPVAGLGIVMPAWISPLISAGLAYLLAEQNPAPVAYIAGTMGTLIGADLLNWQNFKKLGAHLISIGGAGVFDGIFLTGIIAVLIS